MRDAVRFFGQFLVDHGHVSRDALEAAVAFQQSVNVPLGALGLAKGWLSERQVLLVHAEQRRTDRRFGEIAVQRGFLSRAQLDDLLREQAEARMLLGEALVHQGVIARDALDRALADYQREQARAAERVRQELAGAPEPALATLAADVTCRVLLRVAKVAAKCTGVVDEAELFGRERVLWQDVRGPRPFCYVLPVDDVELLDLVAGMVAGEEAGEPRPTEVDDLARELAAELLGAIVGQLAANLSAGGEKVEPGEPQLGTTLPPPHAGPRVVVGLLLPGGPLAFALDVAG